MSSNVISFSSGKGGVGKTTLSTNLAALSARLGKKTLIIDGDWNLGKVALAYGTPPIATIEDVLSGRTTARDALMAVRPNLKLLAAPSGAIGMEELDARSRAQLFYELESLTPDFDSVFLDHSSGVQLGVLEFVAASREHVIVTTPEPASYTDAYAIMKLLSKRFAVRDFRLLVTMAHDDVQTVQAMSRFVDTVRGMLNVRVRMLDVVRWDSNLGNAAFPGKVFVESFPTHRLTAQFEKILQKLESSPSARSNGLSFVPAREATLASEMNT